MPTKRRKVEVHRLTISGLLEGQGYGPFIQTLRNSIPELKRMEMSAGEKSHALEEARLINNRLRLRFFSFTTGHRPDILDTKGFSLTPNPLSPTQTGVEWTHVLGGLIAYRYILLIEKVQTGIHPGTMERYLQWMIDEFYEPQVSETDVDREPVTINLEAEPGEEFIQRLNSLSKVKKATIRIVRPNPGWADLEGELADEAHQSDAGKSEITMIARRRGSLSLVSGIIAAIRNLFNQSNLDYAAIEGDRNDQKDSFTTKNLGKHRFINFQLDDRGQVDQEDVWRKLTQMMDDLE